MVENLPGLVTFHKLEDLHGVPHPFPYQGSKRYLANAIIPLIPNDTKRVIEPFCGSAAVSIAAKYTKKVHEVILADINEPLIDLWKSIVNEPQALVRDYTKMWNEQLESPKEYFRTVRADFNNEPTPARLLYLLNRIVKGAVRYGSDGRFNQSADNRRLGARPKIVESRIYGVHNIMTDTQPIASDYVSVALNASPKDVIYMDPPYQGTSTQSDHRYAASLQRNDFELVLAEMNAKELSYIVSYDAVDSNTPYGHPLSDHLNLTHIHVTAGVSAQATLLGQKKTTIESIYLSPALISRIGGSQEVAHILDPESYALF